MRRHARKVRARAAADLRALGEGCSFDVIALGEAITQHSSYSYNSTSAGSLEAQLGMVKRRKEQVTRWVRAQSQSQSSPSRAEEAGAQEQGGDSAQAHPAHPRALSPAPLRRARPAAPSRPLGAPAPAPAPTHAAHVHVF